MKMWENKVTGIILDLNYLISEKKIVIRGFEIFFMNCIVYMNSIVWFLFVVYILCIIN